MKKALISAAIGAAMIAPAFTSCNDESTIGSSIVQDAIAVVVDSSFTLSGQSIVSERVQSRTTSQLIGRIDAKGFGRLSSDVVTQFMPASQIETEGVSAANIDSLMLYMFMRTGEFVGDSVAPMGLEVYRLSRALPSPIYSNFDPTDYYNPADKLGSTVYNVAINSADTIVKGGVEIAVELPKELGRELFQAYVDNPENFASPSAFAQNVFQGLYIKNSFGSGRLVNTTATMMSLFYHYFEKDSLIRASGNYFAVTPEIITNNDISLEISPEIMQMTAEGANVVMAPVGMEVEVQFPTREIISAFKKQSNSLSVLNSVTFSLPGKVIANDYGFNAPKYLLFTLKSERDEFFAQNKLPDKITSFYAEYNETTGQYFFGDLRAYISKMLEKDTLDPEDYTFTIMPVNAQFETVNSGYNSEQVLVFMMPYMAAPVMASLDLEGAKIKLTYSTQTLE